MKISSPTKSTTLHSYVTVSFNLLFHVVKHSLMQYVCYQLSVSFKLSCGRDHALDLDSSNEHKFSRHLIFHLPNAIFTNNIHAGKCPHKHLHDVVHVFSVLVTHVYLYPYVGNWVLYICDQLRSLKSASEGGMELLDAWRAIFVPGTPPCPPGI